MDIRSSENMVLNCWVCSTRIVLIKIRIHIIIEFIVVCCWKIKLRLLFAHIPVNIVIMIISNTYFIPSSFCSSLSAAAVTSEAGTGSSGSFFSCASKRWSAASARSVNDTNFSVSCRSSFSLRIVWDVLRKAPSNRRQVTSAVCK